VELLGIPGGGRLGSDPNWYELLCPPGHFVAHIAAQTSGSFITQLSATCSDGTALVTEVAGAVGDPLAAAGPTPASESGFSGLIVVRTLAGVHGVQLLMANSSKTELLGGSASSAVSAELLLSCNPGSLTGRRLIGFYGCITTASGTVQPSRVVAALGAVCGGQGEPFERTR